MDLLLPHSETFCRLVAPLEPILRHSKHQRTCHNLSDDLWIQSGILRVLDDIKTGSAFLQHGHVENLFTTKKSHYFESCKSVRRLKHLQGVNNDLLLQKSQQALKENPSANLHESLDTFHLYAGDGHFHAASSHEELNDKGKKDAIGHLYALNLRNSLLSHLALSSDGTAKKPHDMAVLKSTQISTLRQGAQKGERVLYVWDRACINYSQWEKWKQTNGIYFLTLAKSNSRLMKCGNHPFDKTDPINNSILSDEQVGAQSCMIRRVTLLRPETGEEMVFLTNLPYKIPPGVIAHLYFMRWKIEKSFDEIKNKLYEQKAWAKSLVAKKMQAGFNVLAYNLARLMSQDIEELGIKDEVNIKKRERRIEELNKQVTKEKRGLPSLRIKLKEATQLSVKFYRWLRVTIYKTYTWHRSTEQLRLLYSQF